MPNLKDIRKRIAATKNTQKITSAMKMVSAAKLRRAQQAAESARPYAVKMNQVIASLASKVDASKSPLLEPRENINNILVLVVSSDRGLCAGYNSNVFREIERFIATEEVAQTGIKVATIGRKSEGYFKRHRLEVHKNYPGVIGAVTFEKARGIAVEAVQAFKEKEFDAVYVVYNEFISAISYNTKVQQLLPMKVEALGDGEDELGGEFIFEPNEKQLLELVLPNNVEVQVLRALLEAEASEHGARMAAMDNATRNANDMIESMTLIYNRARQAYITKELVEIVSGAEALKG